MTMQHDRYREMLDDLIDGSLLDADRQELTAHLEGCAGCRAELEAITELQARARALPRGLAPSRDLWGGIAQRISEAPASAPVITLDSRRRAMWPVRQWAPLAAAAVLLVVVSSGLTVALMRGPAGGPDVTAAAPVAAGARQDRPVTALAAFRPAQQEFETTVAELEAQLAARRDALAPETVAVIEENLTIIDQAIAEAWAALEADPSSADLSRHLSTVYRQKVDLLDAAVRIAT